MRQVRTQQKSFRVGRVRADRRGKVWYLTYHENGIRHRPRVGPDRQAAKQLAAQINAQLEFTSSRSRCQYNSGEKQISEVDQHG